MLWCFLLLQLLLLLLLKQGVPGSQERWLVAGLVQGARATTLCDQLLRRSCGAQHPSMHVGPRVVQHGRATTCMCDMMRVRLSYTPQAPTSINSL